MDFRPKEILFGTNSDGTKFRIENWNYEKEIQRMRKEKLRNRSHCFGLEYRLLC